MKPLIFFFTFILWSCFVFAADKKLEGIVLMSNGQPASGAQIAVVQSGEFLDFEPTNLL